MLRIFVSRYYFFFLMFRDPPIPTLFPYTTLFRSDSNVAMLRHTVATLAYRGGKALRGAPAEFAEFRELRSEEHTSELQSRFDLVCRLLLEKKNIYSCGTSRRLMSLRVLARCSIY